MITAYPKIFAIGTDYIQDIFNEDVEVTEKIDGSQFDFAKIDGNLYMRSKGAQLYPEKPEKMFSKAISYVESIRDVIPENIIFYTEYLSKPKHNTLAYERVPNNHLMLFGAMHVSQKFEPFIRDYAKVLGLEVVPLLYYGKIESIVELTRHLERDSILGNVKVEGVVVKNYQRPFLLGGQPIPLMTGKFVSEAFKEVHRERWGAEEKTKGKMEIFKESFRTEARWEKAVQHLRDRGELEDDPRDIGKLIREIHNDIEAEEKENIKEFLWKEFKGDIVRRATAGMPEWYKLRLAEKSFKEVE